MKIHETTMRRLMTHYGSNAQKHNTGFDSKLLNAVSHLPFYPGSDALVRLHWATKSNASTGTFFCAYATLTLNIGVTWRLGKIYMILDPGPWTPPPLFGGVPPHPAQDRSVSRGKSAMDRVSQPR